MCKDKFDPDKITFPQGKYSPWSYLSLWITEPPFPGLECKTGSCQDGIVWFSFALLGTFLCRRYLAVFSPTNKMCFICSKRIDSIGSIPDLWSVLPSRNHPEPSFFHRIRSRSRTFFNLNSCSVTSNKTLKANVQSAMYNWRQNPEPESLPGPSFLAADPKSHPESSLFFGSWTFLIFNFYCS